MTTGAGITAMASRDELRALIDRLLDAFTGEDAKIPLPSPAFTTGAVPTVAQQLVWNPEGLEVTQAPAMLGFSLVWIPVGKDASGGWVASGRTGRMLLVP